MQKGQLTRTHWVLFGVALLAFGSLAKTGIQSYLVTRNEAAAANANGRGGLGGRNAQQMGARMLERLTQDLNLSPDQQSQIKAIQESNMPAMQQIRDNTALSREQKREQSRALRTTTETRIRQLLTPEQQTKYDGMMAERRARFGVPNRGGGRNRGSGGNWEGGGAGAADRAASVPEPPSIPQPPSQ